MSDFITLTCPKCGGRLQITDDVERFACAFCGAEHIVRRSGGVVTLKPIVEGLAKVQVGVDKTASELAITRLEEEIARIEEQIQDLNAAHYRELAELDLETERSIQKARPKDVALAADISLDKLVIGLMLLFFFLSVILSILAASERSGTFLAVFFASAFLLILAPIWLFRVIYYRWRASKLPTTLRQIEYLYQEEEKDHKRELADLKKELLDKHRQLVRHRDIVSKTD
jgi:ribosomal protein S27E